MTGGEVAGILVAVFWAILVSFLAVVLVRLAQTLKATTELVADVTEQAVPLLADASATVRSAQTQLDRVDAIATDVQEVTSNASALSSTVASTFGGPLVKVAAFGYGVRRAMSRRTARGARRPQEPLPAYRDRRPHRPGRPRGARPSAEEGLTQRCSAVRSGSPRAPRRCLGHHQGQPQAQAADPREPRGAGREQGDRARVTSSRTSRSTSGPEWPSARRSWARCSACTPDRPRNCPPGATAPSPSAEPTAHSSTPTHSYNRNEDH